MDANSVTWTKVGKWEHCLPASFRHSGREFLSQNLTIKDLEWLAYQGCEWVRKYEKKTAEDKSTETE